MQIPVTKTHCIGMEATISFWEGKDKKNVIVVALLTCLMNIGSHSWTTTYAANHENDIFGYESIATVGDIRVYWRADFQSGSRVLKKVF